MNKLFDIIIIGDSPEGYKALKQLATASTGIKIAYISKTFKSTTTHDFLNVEYIKNEVVLLDYKLKLFTCYLNGGCRLHSTHVIIASGIKYASYLVNGRPVPNVFNTVYDISRSAKNLPAAVVGHDTAAVRMALAVAKKYRQVYLCMDAISPDCSKKLLTTVEATKNLVLLPNAFITKVHTTGGELASVEMSNYSKFICKAIFVKTNTAPELTFVPKKLIAKDADGYCITTANSESTLVPKCYAIGSCAVKYTAKQQKAMINTILADFVEVEDAKY